jgi:N-acetylglucosaminyl-diphospho-decaprenol L-rhamnosyltransferase
VSLGGGPRAAGRADCLRLGSARIVSDVDVVIPTWNGWAPLERCLATLGRQTVAARVIVVDNGSTDGTAERVAERGVELVRLEDNRGFAAAVNRGIAEGSAPIVVLVNNDVECDPQFVERIAAPLRADEAVGSAAALLLFPGRETIDSYGLELDRTLAAFARFAGSPYPATPLDEHHLAGPSGGAAAYRRRALDEVGGFDEAIFAYLEDAELALRLSAAGWRCAGARDAVGVHLGSATFGVRSDWQVETAGASRGYLLRRYGVLRSGPRVAAQALLTEAGVALVDVARERRLAAARGRLRGWRRAGRDRVELAPVAVNPEIGFRESLRRRRAALAA